jgi:hypothetical protein
MRKTNQAKIPAAAMVGCLLGGHTPYAAEPGGRREVMASPYRRCLIALAACVALQACSGGASDRPKAEHLKLSAQPTLSSPAGSVVLLQGDDFGDGCDVRLFLEDIALADVRSDRNGAFAVQVVVPEQTTEGMHTVRAQTLGDSGCNEDADGMTVSLLVAALLPVIEVSPMEGRPGGTVSVAGRAFCGGADCSPVTVLINGLVAADNVPVDSDGTFTVDALVPAVDAAQDIAVVALQTDAAGGRLRAFGDVTVTVRPDVPEGPR